MPTAACVGVMNPYWSATAKAWFYVTAAIGASVTHINATPAHPFAGSLGEYWIKFDGNNSLSGNHQAQPLSVLGNVGATETTTYGLGFSGGAPPDTLHRWGVVHRQLFRVDAAPASRARFAIDANSDGAVYINTDLTVGLDLKIGGSLTTVATSTSTLPTTTNLQLEIWEIGADWTTPGTHQIVVRISTLSAGAQGTVTTLINGQWQPTAHTSFFGDTGFSNESLSFGETTARGAGFNFYTGNVYTAWEDANDPYGIVRVDRLDPTAGNSAKNNQWTTAALGANVDESGTAEPDDVTTIDTVSVTNTTKDQTYGLTNTVIATGSGDKVIRVCSALRTSESGSPPKGSLVRIDVLESDGTNNQLGAAQTSPVVAGSYKSYYQGFDKNPAGGAWDTTSLNSLEMGERADTNSTNAITYNLSTVTTLVAYQASGETMPAVPGAPPKIPSIFVRQGVNRAGTY